MMTGCRLERMIFRQTFAPLFAKRKSALARGWGLMTTAINYHRDCTSTYLFSVRAARATRKRVTQLANFHRCTLPLNDARRRPVFIHRFGLAITDEGYISCDILIDITFRAISLSTRMTVYYYCYYFQDKSFSRFSTVPDLKFLKMIFHESDSLNQ